MIVPCAPASAALAPCTSAGVSLCGTPIGRRRATRSMRGSSSSGIPPPGPTAAPSHAAFPPEAAPACPSLATSLVAAAVGLESMEARPFVAVCGAASVSMGVAVSCAESEPSLHAPCSVRPENQITATGSWHASAHSSSTACSYARGELATAGHLLGGCARSAAWTGRGT